VALVVGGCAAGRFLVRAKQECDSAHVLVGVSSSFPEQEVYLLVEMPLSYRGLAFEHLENRCRITYKWIQSPQIFW